MGESDLYRHRLPMVVALLAMAVAGGIQPVRASEADSLRHGAWGSMPAPSDSSYAEFHRPARPAWEVAVDAPYQLIKLPFTILRLGLKGTVIWADESGAVGKVTQFMGPYPLPGGLRAEFEADGLGGLGVGLDVKDGASRGQHIRAGFRLDLAGGSEARLGLRFEDEALALVMAGGHINRPDQHFHGLGPHSDPEEELDFIQELGWGGLALESELWGGIAVELSGTYTNLGIRELEDQDLIETVPGRALRSRGPAIGMQLRRDSTDQDGRPSEGGVIAFRLLRFFEEGEELADFWHLRGTLERFIGLWNSDQTLALRGTLGWIEPEGEGSVAFARLLSSENPDRFRGFGAGRWRDRGLALASAEYRWPVWAHRQAGDLGLDAMLFGELGQVFPFLDQLGEEVQGGWGGGLRWIGGGGQFASSFEVARSEEGTRFSLQFEQAFQHAKGGIFHGQEAALLR